MATPYWEHRAALRQAAYDRANNKVVETVSRAYDRTMRQLDTDIDTIMATYTRKTGLSVREAYDFLREGVPQRVMDDLRSRAAVISDPRQRKRLEVMLRTDAYRARISRLDAIKASTRVGLTEAAEAELGALEPHLRHTADLAYSRTMFDIQKTTAGFQMAGVPRRALDTILKSKWAGTHYSTSVWQNRDAMAGILDRALMEQSSMGKLSDMTMQDVRGMVDLNKWRNQIKSKFKTEAQYQKYAANRLIRTESAYVANQTTAIAYEECGIERYEFMATLDSRTSEKCSGLDGKIFEMSEKEVGVNYPPLHPHCRSSVAPVIDGLTREGLTRSARDKDGKSTYVPRDMKYQEWQAWQKDGAPADVKAWRESKAPKPAKEPENPLRPAKIAGVEKGEPMDVISANDGKPNPNYSKGGGYDTNCQSCVVTYEARLRGYDVQTLPNVKGSKLDELSRYPHKAWIDPKTGTVPDATRVFASTPKSLYKELSSLTKQDERYTIGFAWKGRSRTGHIISMRKNISDKLELYDPQSGKHYFDTDVEKYFSRIKLQAKLMGNKIDWPVRIMRIDDKAFNPEFADYIMEGAVK
jgi:SPP1 gp7 family putative phage head morphogenesis protein